MPRRSSERNSKPSTQILAVLNSPPASSVSPSPEPQQLFAKPGTMVGKRNTSNRRTSPNTEIHTPVTYTPTTHRISKAKKGKRVHACEFPGCDKVFTRAEHRRRHELNHNPEASFLCQQPGCKRTFHRPDLLARHMERHELDPQPMQSTEWVAPTSAPVTDSSASIPRCVSVESSTGPLLAPAQQSQSNSMSIASIVATSGIHPDLAHDNALMWSGMEIAVEPRAQPIFQIESAADSPFYSSPAETCPSPQSDATFSHPPHSSSSISSGLKTEIASPLQMATPLPPWEGSDVDMPPSQLIPIEDNLMPCQYPSPSWSTSDCLSYEDQLNDFQNEEWNNWTLGM